MKNSASVVVAACLLGGAASGCSSDRGESWWASEEALRQCAGDVVEGIDVSAKNGTIDWPAVRSAGIAFAFMKATQGTTHVNATFAENWRASKEAGVLPSAYHFFDPTKDGVAQAQHFLSVMGPLREGDLPPMLDIECPDGNDQCLGYAGGAGAAPADIILERALAWLRTVEQATNVRPFIYSFNSYFADNGIETAELSGYPLFIASLSSTECFHVPSPWTQATMWQYSWTGLVPGITGEVDRDRFIGTPSELLSLTYRPGALATRTTGVRAGER